MAIARSAVLFLAGCLTAGAVALAISSGEDRTPEPAPSDSPRTSGRGGPRLYLGGDGEVWMVGLDGHVRRLATKALGPGDPPHRIVARHTGLVTWGYDTYLLRPGLKRPPEPIVRGSSFFIPSARVNRVWVAFADDDPDVPGTVAAVREVTAHGKMTVRDIRPPGGAWPEAALADGLLFIERGRRIVWDPVKDEVVFRFRAGDLGPTRGNKVAWCDFGCRRLHVTHVRSGAETAVDPPPGFRGFLAWHGAFSPDGRTIAVPVEGRGGLSVHLALVDLDTAEATLVPSTRTLEPYNFVAWDSTGTHVFFTGSDGSGDRTVSVYRLGDAGARMLPADVGEFYDATAI